MLTHIANWFPMRHFALAILHSFDPTGTTPGLQWSDQWEVLLWGAAGLLVAVRRFRWEPRRS